MDTRRHSSGSVCIGSGLLGEDGKTVFTGRLPYVRACDGINDFAIYDLKGKGATDMWLAGVPLEQVQALCGHESITTTEIYVKSRWRGTIEPNRRVVGE